MTIYLYKKTHNKTGLNYLGKTTQDPFTYKGSGKRWGNHINKHGYDVTTEILRECQTNEEVKEWGLYYSALWNVVESRDWANLKEEYGDGGGIRGEGNGMFGKTHSDEVKQLLSSLSKGKPKSSEHNQKNSEANKGKTKPKIECPHCLKIVGGESNAKRWHFDNCKLRPFNGTV